MSSNALIMIAIVCVPLYIAVLARVLRWAADRTAAREAIKREQLERRLVHIRRARLAERRTANVQSMKAARSTLTKNHHV